VQTGRGLCREDISDVLPTGEPVRKDVMEARLVMEYLPAHIRLTQAKPGCLALKVTPTTMRAGIDRRSGRLSRACAEGSACAREGIAAALPGTRITCAERRD
jgi:hypothetical protein